MLRTFTLNSDIWHIERVSPSSSKLIDRTGTLTVATTDPETRTVYLSSRLHGAFLVKVLLHEIGHCVMVSYGLLDYIHSVVYPDYWIEAEEWLCNFLADYGFQIFSVVYKLVGDEAWIFVLSELDSLVA